METAIKVDEIQDQVDKLVLSVFEAMRAGPAGNDASLVADGVMHQYRTALFSIDNLIGINRSEADQKMELEKLSCDYEASKSAVLNLEKELLDLSALVDDELMKTLQDESIGVGSESASDVQS